MIKIWCVTTGWLIYCIRGLNGFNIGEQQVVVTDLAISRDNKFLASASSDGFIRVFDFADYSPVEVFLMVSNVFVSYHPRRNMSALKSSSLELQRRGLCFLQQYVVMAVVEDGLILTESFLMRLYFFFHQTFFFR